MKSLQVCFILIFCASVFGEGFKETVEQWHEGRVKCLNCLTDLGINDEYIQYPTTMTNDVSPAILNQSQKSSELVLIIPGIFGIVNSDDSIELATFFKNNGYDTLRVTNSLSTEMIHAEPKFRPADVESEAKVFLEIINFAMKKYKYKKISIIGVSYGAFIGGVLSTLVDKSKFSQFVALSPPKNLYVSLSRLDEYISAYQKEYFSYIYEHVKLYLSMIVNLYLGYKVEVEANLAKSFLVLSGFHRGLNNVVLADEDMKSKAYISTSYYDLFFESLRQRAKSLKFLDVITKHNPAFTQSNEKLNLPYWLNKLGPSKWTLFSSEFDFVNGDNGWESNDQQIIIDKFGHYAYRINPTYRKKLKSLFKE